jgi:hypothetical protein
MILVIAAALFVAGLTLIVLGWTELRPSRMFLARPTSAASSLKAGPVEVAGVLRKDGVVPLQSAFGVPCLLVHTIYERRVGRNNYREEARDTVAVPAVLNDASGSCKVDLSHVDLMGESWELQQADGRRITQIVVRDGASVFMAGTATPTGVVTAHDYRGNVPQLIIGPSADSPLLLSLGGESNAVWSYGWRAIVSMLCGVCLLALSAAAAFIHSALP